MEGRALNTDQLTEALIKAAESIPGYDIRKGFAEVDDDFESWLVVTRIFIDTTPGLLEALKAQCEENDPQYTVAVHGLKGICYTVGAVGAGDKAKELELRSKEGDAAFVSANTGNLISIVEKLIGDLSKLMELVPADG